MPEGGAYVGNTYGQWIFETAGKYMESEAEYTADGNYLTKIIGSSTSYNYNTTKGTLTGVTEPGGITTGYAYAASNDLLTGVSRSGSSVSYRYSRKQLKTIVSPNGTSYNNPVVRIDANGDIWDIIFDVILLVAGIEC